MGRLQLTFIDGDIDRDDCMSEVKNWLVDIECEGDWGWKGSVVEKDLGRGVVYIEYEIGDDSVTVEDIVDSILDQLSFIASVVEA